MTSLKTMAAAVLVACSSATAGGQTVDLCEVGECRVSKARLAAGLAMVAAGGALAVKEVARQQKTDHRGPVGEGMRFRYIAMGSAGAVAGAWLLTRLQVPVSVSAEPGGVRVSKSWGW